MQHMEYWSNGTVVKIIVPTLHHSIDSDVRIWRQ